VVAASGLSLPVPAIVGGAVLVVAGVLLALLVWSPWKASSPPAPLVLPPIPTTAVPVPSTSPELVLHAAGAVSHPGVYRLAAGSRVGDLIEAAGGLLPDADVDRLNLAAGLSDGARVYVPTVGEPAPTVVTPEGGAETPGRPGDGPVSGDGLIDINRASATQLEELPGVGPATAAAIIDHRDRVGPFRSVDDLLEVRGIGPAKLEELRSHVRI
jgi:competence protein ComEA